MHVTGVCTGVCWGCWLGGGLGWARCCWALVEKRDFLCERNDKNKEQKYYYSDRNRLAEVEALVLEENVVNYVLGKAKAADKSLPFDELMGNNAQA